MAGQPGRQRAGAAVVEPHPVQQGAVGRQPEHARGRVARLRVRGDGPDLGIPKSQRTPGVQPRAVLVEAGGQPERPWKAHPEHRAGQQRIGRAQQPVQRSARQGDGISERSQNMPWYHGPTLLGALDLLPQPVHALDRPLRLSIQDIYKFDDRRIIAGRIETGRLQVGVTDGGADEAEAAPAQIGADGLGGRSLEVGLNLVTVDVGAGAFVATGVGFLRRERGRTSEQSQSSHPKKF